MALFNWRDTKLAPSSAYHPQTEVQSEITSYKVKQMIYAFKIYRKNNSDDNLVHFEIAYNSTVNIALSCTPFLFNYLIHRRTTPKYGVVPSCLSVNHSFDVVQNSNKFEHDRVIEQNKMFE